MRLDRSCVLAALALAGAAAVVSLGACAREAAPARPSTTGGGATAALPVDIVEFDGLEAVLASHKGKPLLLNVWATWCPPCVAELPEFVEVAQAERANGLDALGLSFDLMVPDVKRGEVVDKVRAFLNARKLPLPTLIYDAPDYEAVNARLNLPGFVPVTLAFDRDGREVGRAEGQADKARFEELARLALGK